MIKLSAVAREEFLTLRQAAKILKKHPATLRRYIKKRQLKATKLAGKYGIYILSRHDVLEFMVGKMMEEKGQKP